MLNKIKRWMFGFFIMQVDNAKREGFDSVDRALHCFDSYTHLSEKLIAYIDSYTLRDYEADPLDFARYSVRDGLYCVLREYAIVKNLELRNYRKGHNPAIIFEILGVKFTIRPNCDYKVAVEARRAEYGAKGLPSWLMLAMSQTDNLVQRYDYCTPVNGAMDVDQLEVMIDNILHAAQAHNCSHPVDKLLYSQIVYVFPCFQRD